MDERLKYIFLKTLEDIESKSNSNEEYDIIKASGLLRLLFLDDKPLIHILNKELKIKLVFKIANSKYEPLFNHLFQWSEIDPNNSRKHGYKELKLHQFLSLKPLYFNGNSYSVKDIIKSSAHFMGGIHFDIPDNIKDINFVEINKIIYLNELQSIKNLRSIINVSLNALYPFKYALIGDS